jgi:hypothetical protein
VVTKHVAMLNSISTNTPVGLFKASAGYSFPFTDVKAASFMGAALVCVQHEAKRRPATMSGDAIMEMLRLIDQQKQMLNSGTKLGDMSDSAISDYCDRNARLSELSKGLTTFSAAGPTDSASRPKAD